METAAARTGFKPEEPVQIERPDLNALGPWLKKHVTEPFEGFADLHRRNGRTFTRAEQLAATHRQLTSMVQSNLKAGINPDAISDMLVDIVTPETPEEAQRHHPTSKRR